MVVYILCGVLGFFQVVIQFFGMFGVYWMCFVYGMRFVYRMCLSLIVLSQGLGVMSQGRVMTPLNLGIMPVMFSEVMT